MGAKLDEVVAPFHLLIFANRDGVIEHVEEGLNRCELEKSRLISGIDNMVEVESRMDDPSFGLSFYLLLFFR